MTSSDPPDDFDLWAAQAESRLSAIEAQLATLSDWLKDAMTPVDDGDENVPPHVLLAQQMRNARKIGR